MDVSLARLDLMFTCRKNILFYVEISSPPFSSKVKPFINYYMPSYMPQWLLVPDLAQFLATRFLVVQHSIISTTEKIKKVAGHQAKCTVVLGLVPKRDRHDETKG